MTNPSIYRYLDSDILSLYINFTQTNLHTWRRIYYSHLHFAGKNNILSRTGAIRSSAFSLRTVWLLQDFRKNKIIPEIMATTLCLQLTTLRTDQNQLLFSTMHVFRYLAIFNCWMLQWAAVRINLDDPFLKIMIYCRVVTHLQYFYVLYPSIALQGEPPLSISISPTTSVPIRTESIFCSPHSASGLEPYVLGEIISENTWLVTQPRLVNKKTMLTKWSPLYWSSFFSYSLQHVVPSELEILNTRSYRNINVSADVSWVGNTTSEGEKIVFLLNMKSSNFQIKIRSWIIR